MKFLVWLAFCLFSLNTQAGEIYETNQSVRALGMGNAYITNASATDAIFYNPSALAKVEGFNWEVANIGLGVNGLDIYNELKDSPDLSRPSGYNQFFGKNVWVRANGRSSFAFPNFGFAGYSENVIDLQLHDPAYPQFNTHFLSDYGFLVGGAIPIGDKISFGLVAKRINRWGGDQEIGVGTIASGTDINGLKDRFQNKGVGYGMDASVMYTDDSAFHPSVALVWQDIGCTAFQKTSGTDAPPRIQDNLSLGLGASLDLPGFDWIASFDYRHINQTGEQLGKKLHLGTEFSLPLIDLRAGVNEGYMTYGAGVNLYFIKIDAAYYAEELGSYPGQTSDNRIQVSLSIDLSFDANFKFTDNNGRNRKLKQRR